MGFRFAAARAVSAISTWGLKHVFRRPAANFPGKIALYADPALIAHLRPRLREGSVVVVGTNGKTTTTNLLADALEAEGKSVVCNRTGANLDSGVATSLLQASGADWGVFESDELWLAKILPHLQANYVLLLNLFRDQLDRCGEIDRIQESIIGALATSPNTVLVYNADDPLCAYIASKSANRSIAFGVAQSMNLVQNTVADAQMCQHCSSMFEYSFRQYGQLGDYRCPHCGFARPALDYAAENVCVSAASVSFDLVGKGAEQSVRSSLGGAYMAYNLAAVATLSRMVGVSGAALQRAIDSFDPQNGRLQTYEIAGRRVLLNLAKNPTGFNQNLRIVNEDSRPKAVAFFINDKEADGHDISWIWDVDFEELANQNCVVYAGGLRKNDLQVRLKYAGVNARLVEGASDVFDRIAHASLPASAPVYLIANYTALPSVRAELDNMAAQGGAQSDAQGESAAASAVVQGEDAATPAALAAAQGEGSAQDADALMQGESVAQGEGVVQVAAQAAPAAQAASASEPAFASPSVPAPCANSAANPLVIVHLFPDLLNLYGDGGNVRILEQRCAWRGIPVEVKRVKYGESVNLEESDLVFLGGGPDREQRLASQELARMKSDLRTFVETDGVLLAICGGYQILGSKWLLGDEVVDGLSIADVETRRPGTSANRLINNIVLDSPLARRPVVGYENHAGRTYIGASLEPFGSVISSVGSGNNEADRADGVLYRNVVGTYLHGPLLSKNPEVADWLLERALDRKAKRTGEQACTLEPLSDAEELAANQYMCARLGVK